MTPEERQELRDWSARLKGWRLNSPDADCPNLWWGDEYGGHIIDFFDWTPDLPSAPASQILSVIEKLEEDGAEIIICKTQTQVFHRGLWYQHGMEERLLNTLKAIFIATNGETISVMGKKLITVHGHPRASVSGYVFEHIVTAERALGKLLKLPHVVHHHTPDQLVE